MVFLKKWRTRISNAIARGKDLREFKYDSKNWNLCAVGEFNSLQPKKIKDVQKYVERNLMGNMTKQLGLDFHEAICNNKPCDAFKVLEKIEQLPNLRK